jgi:glycosyltransferase involved in cell wall biosynthesis
MATSFLPNPRASFGSATVMDGQLRTLQERHEVVLVSFIGADPTDAEAVAEIRRRGIEAHVVHRSVSAGLRAVARRGRLALHWLNGRDPLRAHAFNYRAIQDVLDSLATSRFDRVQVEDIGMGLYTYPRGVPAVLTEHEVRAASDEQPGEGRGLLFSAVAREEHRRWRTFQKRVWSCFDRVQVFSERDGEAIVRLAPNLRGRVRVNPFGIDVPPIRDARQDENGVLFVGGFRHTPNVDAALWLGRQIMPLLRAEYPAVRLTVVGADPPPEVRALASDRVTVTGRVPSVAPYLDAAAVVVAPVRHGGGVRVKVLQAMAAGKAIVATPLGVSGVVDGEANSKPIAVAGDAETFAHETAGLLASKERRRELGEQARRFVIEHRSWASYRERLESIYAELERDA